MLPEQEVLREFRELKSSPTIKGWQKMESLLLTNEELYGMTVDLTKDLQGTASTAA